MTLITRVEVVSNDNANEGRLGVFDLIYNFRIMEKGRPGADPNLVRN